MNGGIFNWLLWGGALLAAGAVALAMPVRLPETNALADPTERLPEQAVEAPPEDLSAFLAIRRWGDPPEEAQPAEPEPVEEAASALNPILAEMGFVGLIATQDERAVLLVNSEGEIMRMLPGNTLPDGRILISVTDNTLTLRGEDQPEEVLTLFPRLSAETAPVPARGDPREGAQSGEDIDLSDPGEAAASP